jgi:hypothetical protein
MGGLPITIPKILLVAVGKMHYLASAPYAVLDFTDDDVDR